MSKKICWGIMGTGRIAGKFCDMLKALAKEEALEIGAVGSRSLEKAREFGAGYGIANCYGSYEELAADPGIDLIYVATPVGSHYENVRLCLEANKNVLCEKTLTEESVQAKELYALARERQLFLMEAMWMKCHPVFQRIMEWQEKGMLGQVQGVDCRFYTKADRNHRLYKNRTQGGVLYDLVLYPLTYACSLLGYRPRRISAAAAIGGDDVDLMNSIQLSYENGSFATLTGGLSPRRQTCLYIHGTKGRVLIDTEEFHCAQRVALVDWDNQVVEELDQPFACNGYEYEALEAMECVRQGRTVSSLVPMEETIAMITLMEECRSRWREEDSQHK